MMKNFTQKFMLCVCMIAMTGSYAIAQSFMIVNSPGSVAGEYEVELGTVGATDGMTITGDLALGDDGVEGDTNMDGVNGTTTDGCEEIMNNVSGSIVVIDRGECPFTDKAMNAEASGAIALLVCNDRAEAPIVMTGAGMPVGIPCYMASQADCDAIKMIINGGDAVNVTFETREEMCPVTYGPEVFFGQNPGEGDFSVPFEDAGWQTVNLAPLDRDEVIWERGENGIPIFSQFFGSGVEMNSPSACDGTAQFSFVKHAIGDNPAPTQPYTTYSAELISPVIDCSDKNAVVLEYFQGYNRLNQFSAFAWSTDGGDTWTQEDIEYQGVVNEMVDIRTVTKPMPDFAGQAECRFKFIANGDFYYWSIDDVILKEEEIRDVRINTGWVASAPNHLTPSDFADQMGFLLDIENVGNVDLTGVNVNVKVLDPSGATVHEQDLAYGVVAMGQLIENRYFAETFTPASGDGVYTIRYELSAEGGDNMDNNIFESEFTIGGDVFSKTRLNNLSGWRRGAGDYFSYGNYYHFPKASYADGSKVVLDKVRGGISTGETSSLGFIYAEVYAWTDLNGDGNVDDDGERRLIANSGSKTSIADGTLAGDLEFELFDANDDEAKYVLDLDDDQGIVVMIHGENLDATGEWFYPSLNTAGFPEFNVYASQMVFDSLEIERGSGFWVDRSGPPVEGETFASDATLVWFAPLTIGRFSSSVDFDSNISFNTFPNPTTDFLNVDLAFDGVEKETTLKIIDATGKMVDVQRVVNIQNKKVTFDVSELTSGMYTLRVETLTGFNTQNFVVQR